MEVHHLRPVQLRHGERIHLKVFGEQASNHRELSLLIFRIAVMHQMCDDFSSCKRVSKGSVHEVVNMLERDVIPGYDLVQFEGRKKACQACIVAHRPTSNGRCVETSYGCSLCRASLYKYGPVSENTTVCRVPTSATALQDHQRKQQLFSEFVTAVGVGFF